MRRKSPNAVKSSGKEAFLDFRAPDLNQFDRDAEGSM